MNHLRGQMSAVWVLAFFALKHQSLLSDAVIREQILLAGGLKLLACSQTI